MRVLVRAPGDMDAAERTHIERLPIDSALCHAQHKAYCVALEKAGADLTILPALNGHADACFVEDVVIALPECFIVCRPGAASRRDETVSITGLLPKDRPVFVTPAPATLDGGDVLVIGAEIFVGRTSRTNEQGLQYLEQTLRQFGYDVKAVPVRGALHLKTAVTSAGDGLILINPLWIDTAPFQKLSWIETPTDEPFGGNCLQLGKTTFIPKAHQKTRAALSARGVGTQVIDISEFAKAEAGLTCLSVLIPPSTGRGH